MISNKSLAMFDEMISKEWILKGDTDGDNHIKSSLPDATDPLIRTFVHPSSLDPVRCECELKANSIPVPYRIFENWHDGKIWTTVEWTDKTKTTVSIKDSEDAANTFDAFTAALAKKVYGNMTKTIELMDAALDKAEEPARERVRHREMIKEAKRCIVETERHLNELAIKMEMDKIRIQREAEKRINEEEEKKTFE